MGDDVSKSSTFRFLRSVVVDVEITLRAEISAVARSVATDGLVEAVPRVAADDRVRFPSV